MKIKIAFLLLIFTLNSPIHSQETWVPIFSSSGGSAHEVTATILKEDFENQGIEASVINVTRSPCTITPRIGKFFTDIWDNAQFSGNVKRQTLLLKFQKTFDSLFYLTSYHFIKQALHRKEKLPHRVVLTSPLFLHAISNAVYQSNLESPDSKINYIDLYMVESPSNEAIYYYRPLKKLSQEKRELIRLFTLPPSADEFISPEEEELFWFEKTGLSRGSGQIVYNPPLGKRFRHSEKLPAPGQSLNIVLKAQCDKEREFLETCCDVQQENQFTFSIQGKDTIGLIMLGSIPSERSILNYIDAVMSSVDEEPSQNNCYLFIACGKPHLGLYQKAVEKIDNNMTKVRIIPFTAQSIETIFARADFTITRSGGMTLQEILALKTNPLRRDSKTIYIHAEVSPRDSLVLDEEALIEKGIPLWEGGNANYLKKTIDKIHIVTPELIAPFLKSHF